MKKLLIFVLLIGTLPAIGQVKHLKLTNALVIGKIDKAEDRYSIEINLTELLNEAGVKAIPSLNIVKTGSDPQILAGDSVQQLLKSKGVDTYILVSVRGYDRKYQFTDKNEDFSTALEAANLYGLYREEASSVSFEFLFYRNGKLVSSDMIRCKNISSRDTVIKRLRKKLKKHIAKKWK